MPTAAAEVRRYCACQVGSRRREYPEVPRLGVAATVLSKALPRRVLLVRRGQPPGEGSWSLPGGLVDLGERVGPAALREVQEETMLVATLAKDQPNESAAFYVTDEITLDKRGRVLYHYVLCHVLCLGDDTVDPVASDDAADAQWVGTSNLLRGDSPACKLLPKTLAVLKAALAIVDDEPRDT